MVREILQRALCGAFMFLFVASSAIPQEPRSPVLDVALQPDGRLVGYVVDLQGRTQSGQQVSCVQDHQATMSVTSDQDGRFVIPQVEGGLYELVVGVASTPIRAWVAGTEPPSAVNSILLEGSGLPIKRGQSAAPAAGTLLAPAVTTPFAWPRKVHWLNRPRLMRNKVSAS